MSDRPELKKHILGIHAEGPFISNIHGCVGAHNPKWTRNPNIDFLKKMQDCAGGKIKILTIAAELPGAAKLCEYACKNGISVFLGHQNARLEDLEKLADCWLGYDPLVDVAPGSGDGIVDFLDFSVMAGSWE